jgi:hypothetical protein
MTEPGTVFISNPDVVLDMREGYESFGNVRFLHGEASFLVGNKVILRARQQSENNGVTTYSLIGESGNNFGKIEVQRPMYNIPFIRNWVKVLTVYDSAGTGLFAGRSLKNLFGKQCFCFCLVAKVGKHMSGMTRMARKLLE